MASITKDLPLSEVTLRRYEKPGDMKGRELVRRLCLSLGLLQPGDSRDVIVDILMVLLNARKNKEELDSIQIKDRVIEMRKQSNVPLLGIAHSNIRRQLKRLKDQFIIEANVTKYRVTEFLSLNEVFKEKCEGYLLKSITDRVYEYLDAVDNEFEFRPN